MTDQIENIARVVVYLGDGGVIGATSNVPADIIVVNRDVEAGDDSVVTIDGEDGEYARLSAEVNPDHVDSIFIEIDGYEEDDASAG